MCLWYPKIYSTIPWAVQSERGEIWIYSRGDQPRIQTLLTMQGIEMLPQKLKLKLMQSIKNFGERK